MRSIHRGIALALIAGVGISACRKTPETIATPTPTPTPIPSETCDAACRQRRADSIAADAAAREKAAADAAARARAMALEAAKNTLRAAIYFDYDAADIRGDARTALDQKLPILRANAGIQIRISGHADERGSDQYNDALGQRRAASTKRYLTDNGIDAARITIISYGEQKPAMPGSDENAWARNRRAEFDVTAGDVTVVPPQ
jgi:peptidoglycan-associated lipoprotein